MKFGSRIYAIFGCLMVSAVASASLAAGSVSAAPIQCFVHVAAAIHPRCDGGGDGEPGDGDPTGGGPFGGDPTGGAPSGPPEGPPEGGDPTDPGSSEPGNGDPGAGNPGDGDPGSSNPGDGNPGDGDPGDGDPGEADPGAGNPSSGDPGTSDPGESDPGVPDPGDGNPGGGNPGDGNPDEGKGTLDPGSADPNPGEEDPSNPDDPGKDPDGKDQPDLPAPVHIVSLSDLLGHERNLLGSVVDVQGRYVAAMNKLDQVNAQIAQLKERLGNLREEYNFWAQILAENSGGRGIREKGVTARDFLSIIRPEQQEALQALKALEHAAKNLSAVKKPKSPGGSTGTPRRPR